MSGTLIKKITPKTVLGASPTPPEKATALFRVMGIASGVRTGRTQYGDFTGLTGQFEAVRIDTGETFIAPQCFLPEPMNGMIAAKVQTRDEETGNTMTAQFAVEVGVKPATNNVGYEYTVRPIVEVEEADPLAALRKALPPVCIPKRQEISRALVARQLSGHLFKE